MQLTKKELMAISFRAGIFPKYASDSDFVTAKGAAAEEGDVYWNTGSKNLRKFGTAWAEIGGSGTATEYPPIITLWLENFDSLVGSSFYMTQVTYQRYSYLSERSDYADGDTIVHDFVCGAGTYSVSVLGRRNNNCAKVDWYIDTTKIISLQNWYGTENYNERKTVTGISIAAGKHTLKCVTNGYTVQYQYKVYLTNVVLRRTGD
jgi:hypothetical protein